MTANNHPLHHVAVIMDGNGRWSEQRGRPRTEGHHAGAKRAKCIIQAAGQAGVPFLTLWAFSTENWKRPRYEIEVIMNLMRRFIVQEADELFHMTDDSLLAEVFRSVPPYDLVIRSGGEQRTSNFPTRHAEVAFVDTLWPDFSPAEFNTLLEHYGTRERRFGGVGAIAK
jgi:undecaprenyl pyrophosphate synthase